MTVETKKSRLKTPFSQLIKAPIYD